MSFIEPNLEIILEKLNRITSDTQPLWGDMVAQRMVEHLSDSIDVSTGILPLQLQIPIEQLPGALAHLHSDKPMPQNFKASYAPPGVPLRNDEIETAIDELTSKWIGYEEFFDENPTVKTMHPVYGELDFEGWQRMHSKHFTHHFTQFGLI